MRTSAPVTTDVLRGKTTTRSELERCSYRGFQQACSSLLWMVQLRLNPASHTQGMGSTPLPPHLPVILTLSHFLDHMLATRPAKQAGAPVWFENAAAAIQSRLSQEMAGDPKDSLGPTALFTQVTNMLRVRGAQHSALQRWMARHCVHVGSLEGMIRRLQCRETIGRHQRPHDYKGL